MELSALYDKEKKLTGRVHGRGEPREPGEYVLGAGAWVTDGERLLVTLRSPEKQAWPGYWENPGGMVRAGETSEEGCRRELFEETGIQAPPGALHLLYSRRDDRFCAFFDSYLLRLPERPVVCLQPGETADFRWLTPAEVDELCAAGRVAGPIREDWALLREKLITELDAWKIKDKQ